MRVRSTLALALALAASLVSDRSDGQALPRSVVERQERTSIELSRPRYHSSHGGDLGIRHENRLMRDRLLLRPERYDVRVDAPGAFLGGNTCRKQARIGRLIGDCDVRRRYDRRPKLKARVQYKRG
jgi:hypothetical protein